MKKLNVFDFDGTIYNGDSSIDFYVYCLKKNILLIRYLPIQIYGAIVYKLKLKPKEFFKEKYFSFLNGEEDIDLKVREFWQVSENKIRYNIIKDKENLVIISASPEFLLKQIAKKIGAIKLIATKVDKHTGRFLSKNCHGKEKVKRLNLEFNEYILNEFYSDSQSDRFLAEIATKSFLVKRNKIIEWKNHRKDEK